VLFALLSTLVAAGVHPSTIARDVLSAVEWQAGPSLPPVPPPLIVGCAVNADPDGRVYELRGAAKRWLLFMRSKKAGSTPVMLPLPDAAPSVNQRDVMLSYSSLNGGRAVEWRVTPSEASLDVHANFELEVNVDADLDPRVELMNTDGAITHLTCEIAPPRK
jgi:hypothetical protein